MCDSAHRRRHRVRHWLFAGLMAGSAGLLFVMSEGTRGEPAAGPVTPVAAHVTASSPEEAGKYLVEIAGCNDCHTPGYAPTDGNVPESQWLTGLPVGWRGPWGTTYASNLRLFVQEFDEPTWVMVMKARKQRPPMPWPSLRAMSDQDLGAIYRYIKSLGPTGEKMPAATGPNEEPKTPYFVLDPQLPKS